MAAPHRRAVRHRPTCRAERRGREVIAGLSGDLGWPRATSQNALHPPSGSSYPCRVGRGSINRSEAPGDRRGSRWASRRFAGLDPPSPTPFRIRRQPRLTPGGLFPKITCRDWDSRLSDQG
jgi:hypothetical protein